MESATDQTDSLMPSSFTAPAARPTRSIVAEDDCSTRELLSIWALRLRAAESAIITAPTVADAQYFMASEFEAQDGHRCSRAGDRPQRNEAVERQNRTLRLRIIG